MISRRTFGFASAAALLAGWGLFSRTTSAKSKQKTVFEITKTDAEWRKKLTRQQFYVLRQHGTERPFTSPLDKIYAKGTYRCAGCGLAVYSSETKFDSRTGWPSFWQPIENAIGTTTDYFIGYPRTEVHCRRCGGHLGHVFGDGPKPTGKRYCMNGVAMTFVAAKAI